MSSALARFRGWLHYGGATVEDARFLCVQRAAFVGVDEEFYRAVHAREGPLCDAGATALAALVWGRALFVANAGDSRAVLSRRGRAVELSTDHKPTCQSELARIISAGTGLWCLNQNCLPHIARPSIYQSTQS